ncbi:hypothetical protein GGH96_000537 [Coemansia sp. RSA 1972]|nr:hypothetical protein GGH96_000537 [Coemansia sp. RSA 1972]
MAQNNKTTEAKPAETQFNQKLDANVNAMQTLLGSLAAKVELAERDTQTTDATAPQAVGDALKDAMLAEKALGSFEAQLDTLLDRLDALIDEAPEPKEKS